MLKPEATKEKGVPNNNLDTDHRDKRRFESWVRHLDFKHSAPFETKDEAKFQTNKQQHQ